MLVRGSHLVLQHSAAPEDDLAETLLINNNKKKDSGGMAESLYFQVYDSRYH